MMAAMWIVWLLFGALVVVGLVLLVRALRRGGGERSSRGAGPSEALTILEQRYAQGEIDQDEFEERRRTLRS